MTTWNGVPNAYSRTRTECWRPGDGGRPAAPTPAPAGGAAKCEGTGIRCPSGAFCKFDSGGGGSGQGGTHGGKCRRCSRANDKYDDDGSVRRGKKDNQCDGTHFWHKTAKGKQAMADCLARCSDGERVVARWQKSDTCPPVCSASLEDREIEDDDDDERHVPEVVILVLLAGSALSCYAYGGPCGPLAACGPEHKESQPLILKISLVAMVGSLAEGFTHNFTEEGLGFVVLVCSCLGLVVSAFIMFCAKAEPVPAIPVSVTAQNPVTVEDPVAPPIVRGQILAADPRRRPGPPMVAQLVPVAATPGGGPSIALEL